MAPARNPEGASLKNRRATTATAAAAAKPTDPPLADVAVAIGEEASRRYPALFDPREPVFAPMEASGTAPPGVVDDRYVIAPEDASEQLYPNGCRTPVVRSLWRKGQHVPRHVFEAWQARQQEAEESPEPTTEPTPEAPAQS